ncbi:MAG: hypothetical protein ACTJLL_02040 [Anaplasma sp.]
MICAAIPGLVETVMCAVQAFKRDAGEIGDISFLRRYLKHLSIVSDFSVHELEKEEIAAFTDAHERFTRELAQRDIPSHAHFLILVEAMYSAKREVGYHAEMEDNLMHALNAFLGKGENNGPYFDKKECTDMAGVLLHHLGEFARRDKKATNAVYIEELVACGIARTIQELANGKQVSAAQLWEIAESAPERLGKLLAEQGDMIHERLNYGVLCNDIGKQQLIPACVVDVDVSPKLQRLTEVLKFGDLGEYPSSIMDETQISSGSNLRTRTASSAH